MVKGGGKSGGKGGSKGSATAAGNTACNNTSTTSVSETSNNHATDCPCTKDNLAINLLEALDDKTVAAKLRKILTPDYDKLADIVAAKLSVRLKKLEDELHEKNEVIDTLKRRLENAENKLDDTEQYSRRTSVRIAGIPEDAAEDVEAKVNEVFHAMNVKPIINRVHRVGPKNTNMKGPRMIICQFTTFPDKKAVLSAKKTIQQSHPRVYINEDLTRQRARIFFIARQKKKEGAFSDVWTADGRICVKDTKNKIHYFTRLHELSDLIAANPSPLLPRHTSTPVLSPARHSSTPSGSTSQPTESQTSL